MTMYQDVVRDFVRRTRRNLELVREQSAAEERAGTRDGQRSAFEVTQLVNSLLGLLVFPQQRYFDAIPHTPLADLARDGWPTVRAIDGFPNVDHLDDLMRYLRNAVAHFNIEFTEQGGQNSGVRVWNKPPGQPINWKSELAIRDLQTITERFSELRDKRLSPANGGG